MGATLAVTVLVIAPLEASAPATPPSIAPWRSPGPRAEERPQRPASSPLETDPCALWIGRPPSECAQ